MTDSKPNTPDLKDILLRLTEGIKELSVDLVRQPSGQRQNEDFFVLDKETGSPPPRRFPPPWCVEEHPESFAIVDGDGQALVHVYHEDEPGRRMAMKRLTKDEAQRIAVNIAKLPEFIRGRDRSDYHEDLNMRLKASGS
jgi:hypothetical protein